MDSRPDFSKQEARIVSNLEPLPKVTDFSAVQPRKAFKPSEVTLSGIAMEVSDSHPSKRLVSIFVRALAPLAIVNVVRALQPLNVVVPIVAMLAGREIDFRDSQFWNAYVPMVVRAESAEMFTVSSEMQPVNAELPMTVTVSGSVISFNDVQPLNALAPL